MADFYLATLVLLPAIITYLLRSNAASGFLALCGGFSLLTLSGSDIEQLVGKTRITSLTSNNVDLALLAGPLLVTLLLTYRSVTRKKSRTFQLIPALLAGGLLAVLAGPMLSGAISTSVTDSQFWKALHNAQTYIVGAGLFSSLLLVWFSSQGSHPKKHK